MACPPISIVVRHLVNRLWTAKDAGLKILINTESAQYRSDVDMTGHSPQRHNEATLLKTRDSPRFRSLCLFYPWTLHSGCLIIWWGCRACRVLWRSILIIDICHWDHRDVFIHRFHRFFLIIVIAHRGRGGKQRFGAVFIRPPITSATSLWIYCIVVSSCRCGEIIEYWLCSLCHISVRERLPKTYLKYEYMYEIRSNVEDGFVGYSGYETLLSHCGHIL